MQVLLYAVSLAIAFLYWFYQSRLLRQYFAEKRKRATDKEFEDAVSGKAPEAVAKKYFDGEVTLEKTIYVVIPLELGDEEVAERFFAPIVQQLHHCELGVVDRLFKVDEFYGIDISLNDFVSGLQLVIGVLKENGAPRMTVIEYDDIELPLYDS